MPTTGGAHGGEKSAGDAGGDSDPALGGGGSGGSSEEGPSIAVTTGTTLRTQRGEASDLVVSITREGGFAGAVEVSVEGLPAGVGATPVTLAGVEEEAKLSVVALSTANPGGPTPIVVRAQAVEDAELVDEVNVDFYVSDLPGEQDRTFGSDGNGIVNEKITDRELDVVRDLAIDTQGRIVVAGEGEQPGSYLGWVLRVNPAGELDTGFAGDGIFDEFGDPSSVTSKLLLVDDAPLVAAQTSNDTTFTSYVRKLTPTGKVDTTYGTGGDVAYGKVGLANLLQWGGGVMVFMYPPSNLQALSDEGTRDASFNLTGSPSFVAVAVAVDSQKRVLYGGKSAAGPFTAGRLTASGAPDLSFGTNGVASFPMTGAYQDYQARDLATYPDDAGVMLAQAYNNGGPGNQVVLIRFDANGHPDPHFGTDGMAAVTDEGFALELIVQDDGKVVVLYANPVPGLTPAYALARFGLDGKRDESFGAAGTLELQSIYAGYPEHLAYDAVAGRLIAGGYNEDGISLLRLWL